MTVVFSCKKKPKNTTKDTARDVHAPASAASASKNDAFAEKRTLVGGARTARAPARQDKQRLMLNKRQRPNRTAETESTDSGERSEGEAVYPLSYHCTNTYRE